MTLFEYLAMAFSLLFSISTMRLVGGVPHVLRSHRRYWVHATLVAWHQFLTIAMFWAFFSYHQVTWTFPGFVLALGSPVLIYFTATTLVPEDAQDVQSWREYHMSVYRRYFGGLIAWQSVVLLGDLLVLDQPLRHPVRLVQGASLLLFAVGAVTSRSAVQAFVVGSLVVLMAAVALTLARAPGSFAPL